MFGCLRYYYSIICLCLSVCAFTNSHAQTSSADFRSFRETPRHYVCYRREDSIALDGKPAEAAWEQAPWSEDFLDITGDKKLSPHLRTRVKMLWDDQYLYIAAWLEEPHVWGNLHQHDTIIYHDNDFEVFIDPDGDTHQYYEIEINALNTIMDLFMVKPYRNGGNAMLAWDTRGLRSAVHVNGTLNQPADKDTSWTVEMAIPFRALRFFPSSGIPSDGAHWRINFSRVQWDTDIVNGRYVKRPHTPEHNWVWSPQGIIDMHNPERWGYLQFSKSAGTAVFKAPAYATADKLLWRIYYAQQQYRKQHGRYAGSITALGITDGGISVKMEATSKQFTAGAGERQINETGSIH